MSKNYSVETVQGPFFKQPIIKRGEGRRRGGGWTGGGEELLTNDQDNETVAGVQPLSLVLLIITKTVAKPTVFHAKELQNDLLIFVV